MTVKTVFFDMGGTIDTNWYSPEMRLAATPALQKYLLSHGLNFHLDDKQLYELITTGLASYHKWRLATQEELPPSQVWREYIFINYPADFNRLDSIAEDLMVWIETHYYQRQMRPEIPAVLDSLQKNGYKIGLISNVNSRGQVPLNLSQYGIKHYFDPIVLSSEYRHRKPNPAIFHYAARLSNTPTSECIFIGDRISRDILGSKRAGYKLAIQIEHAFKHGETDNGATPDFVIKNMTELLDILHSERQAEKPAAPFRLSDKHIRAILFDADGILYYRNNKDHEFYSYIKEIAGTDKEIQIAEIHKISHQAFIGQMTFDQYKTAVLNMHGITDPDLVSRGIQISKNEKEKIIFFADTYDTLNKLKNRHLYLGIVTDTIQPLYVKLNKLERGGIGNLWDSIIPSSEVGLKKPDPRIYQLALQQLGIKSSQAVFVGHKSSELIGAQKAGIKTVAFNYDKDAEADFYIDNFSELADLPILN